MPTWNVLIVEDDAPMREFFAASVARRPELALAGSAGTVAEAYVRLDDPARVDVLLVDLGLPDGSGLDVIRHARRRHPECEPLVISMFGDEDSVLASIEAGALGYIHKDAAPEDIARTIIEMKNGASPISPMIARRVLARYLHLQRDQPKTQAGGKGPSANESGADDAEAAQAALSRREREVLELIARGLSYAEIARLHAVSVNTVQSQIKSLYVKLGVHSRSEAVFEATQLGLLPGAR